MNNFYCSASLKVNNFSKRKDVIDKLLSIGYKLSPIDNNINGNDIIYYNKGVICLKNVVDEDATYCNQIGHIKLDYEKAKQLFLNIALITLEQVQKKRKTNFSC